MVLFACTERQYPSYSDRTGAQTMLYLTCTRISGADLEYYGVFRAKDRVPVDCGTMTES